MVDKRTGELNKEIEALKTDLRFFEDVRHKSSISFPSYVFTKADTEKRLKELEALRDGN